MDLGVRRLRLDNSKWARVMLKCRDHQPKKRWQWLNYIILYIYILVSTKKDRTHMQDVMLMLWLCYHPDFPLFFSIFWGLLYSRNGWFQIPSTPRTRKCYRSAPWPDVIHHILYGCLEFIGVLNMKGLGIIIPWFFHHYIIIFLYLFVYLLKGKWLCL